MSAPLDLLTFGEAMLAFRADQPWRTAAGATLSVAGAEATVAIAAARLGHRVAWASRVGDDEPGARVVNTLRAEGVDVSGVHVDPDAATGLILFDRAPGGAVRATYARAGSAASRLGPGDLEPLLRRPVRHLHVTGITPALGPGPAQAVAQALVAARSAGASTSLDVNYRSRLWSPHQARTALEPVLENVSVLVASAQELAVLVADGRGAGSDDGTRAVAAVLARGVEWVAVPAGERGARLFTRDGGVLAAPARRVTAVDPVGAGDAFTAGLLSGRLDGLPAQECLERGVVLGACAVATVGDWEGLPTRAQLDGSLGGDVLR